MIRVEKSKLLTSMYNTLHMVYLKFKGIKTSLATTQSFLKDSINKKKTL